MQKESFQLEATVDITSSIWTQANLKVGDVFWVHSREAARHLLEANLCRYAAAAAPQAQPEQRKLLRKSAAHPIDRFDVVTRVWEGETVVCVGGGPSLTPEQLELTRGKHVIAVNDAYLIAPWAEVCYFADHRWWEWHTKGISKDFGWFSAGAPEVKRLFEEFAGQKCTIENTGHMVSDQRVFMLHNLGSDRLSETPNGLHTGSNSGYQAINLAVLGGAKRVLLIGYDMNFKGDKSHAHNGHPTRAMPEEYSRYAKTFRTMVPQLQSLGVEVINCTPGSLVDAFPRGELASLLPNS